jgi:hypothetical protein
MIERGMSSQVSGESEVELKCFSVVEEIDPPNGAPSLPFYRPREGPGVHEREEQRKEKKQRRQPQGFAALLLL